MASRSKKFRVSAGAQSLPDLAAIEVLGTPLTVTNYSDLIALCGDWGKKTPVAIDFTNTQIVTMRRHDQAFRELTGYVDRFIPDGMPLIWALNDRGAGLQDRVYGPTFMRECVLKSPPERTHYFLGGSEECLTKLREVFEVRRPEVRIVGSRHGYFGSEDEAAIVEEINALEPDLIWVGLGTPKQQEWIERNKPLIRCGVVLAVGFAFDVNAGTKPDAPAWMQRLGLTWFFRMASEPGRLVGRYLKYNTLFLAYLLRDSIWSRDPAGSIDSEVGE
jgi:N-acetylglucosaminyldiphosphoundecaprenol N-acetyl-beta-D-mannosaminyltransferase